MSLPTADARLVDALSWIRTDRVALLLDTVSLPQDVRVSRHMLDDMPELIRQGRGGLLKTMLGLLPFLLHEAVVLLHSGLELLDVLAQE